MGIYMSTYDIQEGGSNNIPYDEMKKDKDNFLSSVFQRFKNNDIRKIKQNAIAYIFIESLLINKSIKEIEIDEWAKKPTTDLKPTTNLDNYNKYNSSVNLMKECVK